MTHFEHPFLDLNFIVTSSDYETSVAVTPSSHAPPGITANPHPRPPTTPTPSASCPRRASRRAPRSRVCAPAAAPPLRGSRFVASPPHVFLGGVVAGCPAALLLPRRFLRLVDRACDRRGAQHAPPPPAPPPPPRARTFILTFSILKQGARIFRRLAKLWLSKRLTPLSPTACAPAPPARRRRTPYAVAASPPPSHAHTLRPRPRLLTHMVTFPPQPFSTPRAARQASCNYRLSPAAPNRRRPQAPSLRFRAWRLWATCCAWRSTTSPSSAAAPHTRSLLSST